MLDWDGNELLLSDILGTDEDIIYRDMENEAEIKLLRDALESLSAREKQIICLRYGIGTKDGIEMTQKEVAGRVRVTGHSYISRLEKENYGAVEKRNTEKLVDFASIYGIIQYKYLK